MSDPTDDLIHLDGLIELANRAAAFHEVGTIEDLDYERFGVCTPDLIAVSKQYAVNTIAAMGVNSGAFVAQFLTGFDLGYQARLEMESRTLAKADISDTYVDEVQGDPTRPYDQEQDG